MDNQYYYDSLMKLALIGDEKVGKSSIIQRYSDETFSFSENYIASIGIEFRCKYESLGDYGALLQLWDLCGQSRFRTIITNNFKTINGFIIVYDVTNEESFTNLDYWLKLISDYTLPVNPIPKLIVGNKTDSNKDRKISYEQGLEYATSRGMKFIETSAKDNLNITKAFLLMINDMYEIRKQIHDENSKIKEVNRTEEDKGIKGIKEDKGFEEDKGFVGSNNSNLGLRKIMSNLFNFFVDK